MALISNERPCYRILSVNGFWGPDDHLYQEGETIYFDDEPNEEMEPLNEPARVRLNTYLEKLDTLAKAAAEKLGKPFIARPRNLDGALVLATELARQNMSIMGDKNKEVSSIERVEKDPVPETGAVAPKKRGRPSNASKNKPQLLAEAAA